MDNRDKKGWSTDNTPPTGKITIGRAVANYRQSSRQLSAEQSPKSTFFNRTSRKARSGLKGCFLKLFFSTQQYSNNISTILLEYCLVLRTKQPLTSANRTRNAYRRISPKPGAKKQNEPSPQTLRAVGKKYECDDPELKKTQTKNLAQWANSCIYQLTKNEAKWCILVIYQISSKKERSNSPFFSYCPKT